MIKPISQGCYEDAMRLCVVYKGLAYGRCLPNVSFLTSFLRKGEMTLKSTFYDI